MTSNLCKSTSNIYLTSSELEWIDCPLPLNCKHTAHCCVAGVNLQDFSGSLMLDQLSLVAASCDLINLIAIELKATFDLSGQHLTWTLLDSKFKTGFIYLETNHQAKFMRLCPSKLTYEFYLKEDEIAEKFVFFLKVKHVDLILVCPTPTSTTTSPFSTTTTSTTTECVVTEVNNTNYPTQKEVPAQFESKMSSIDTSDNTFTISVSPVSNSLNTLPSINSFILSNLSNTTVCCTPIGETLGFAIAVTEKVPMGRTYVATIFTVQGTMQILNGTIGDATNTTTIAEARLSFSATCPISKVTLTSNEGFNDSDTVSIWV